MLAWYRKGCTRLEYSPNLILEKDCTEMWGKVQSIQRGSILDLWELSVRCCLTHIHSFMCLLPSSPIFWCQTLQSGRTAAGSHNLHSPHPPSLRLPLFTSLSSSCAGLQARGPVSSFPLFLHTGCKIWLLPLPLFYLLRMKPSQMIKCPGVIHISDEKLHMMATQREHLTYDWLQNVSTYLQLWHFMCSNPSPQSCENRMSACSH